MMNHKTHINAPIFVALVWVFVCSCKPSVKPVQQNPNSHKAVPKLKSIAYADTGFKVIHVFVALCDNKYQGIVPVPPAIGNGQDPETNLYWGCDNGVRTYFKKSKDWQLLKKQKGSSIILERLIFRHRTKKIYLVADAWDGQAIEKTTEDFLFSCAGQLKDTIHYNRQVIGINGNAQLLAYIGHDGLMDFRLSNKFKNADGKTRDCIVLVCISKKYFNAFIDTAKANPLLYATGLMCPEAYTLHDALTGYVNNEPREKIRQRAVATYVKYQKFSIQDTDNLLVSNR
jgi:hypothetical protein